MNKSDWDALTEEQQNTLLLDYAICDEVWERCLAAREEITEQEQMQCLIEQAIASLDRN